MERVRINRPTTACRRRASESAFSLSPFNELYGSPLSLSLDAVFANQIRVTLSLFTTYLVKALSGSIITPEEP